MPSAWIRRTGSDQPSQTHPNLMGLPSLVSSWRLLVIEHLAPQVLGASPCFPLVASRFSDRGACAPELLRSPFDCEARSGPISNVNACFFFYFSASRS